MRRRDEIMRGPLKAMAARFCGYFPFPRCPPSSPSSLSFFLSLSSANRSFARISRDRMWLQYTGCTVGFDFDDYEQPLLADRSELMLLVLFPVELSIRE